MKKNKWQVGITISHHFIVTLEAEDHEEACNKAIESSINDPQYFKTAQSTIVTSLLINDSATKGFAPYVPEFIGNQDEKK